MRSTLRILLPVLALLLCSELAFPQACGYIHAKFFVRDSNDKFIESAKLELLSPANNDSIMYRERELSWLADEGAFRIHHGLCGSHNDTRLVVKAPTFERFEAIIDLPLNSPFSQHVFTVRLKRTRSNDLPSIEQWATLTGHVTDPNGDPIVSGSLLLAAKDGATLETKASEYGRYSFYVKEGEYSLEAVSPTTAERIKSDLRLKPGQNWHDIAFKVTKEK